MASSLKSIANIFVLSALSFYSSGSLAQDNRTYLASIPFEFHLSYGVMPAGDYQILSVNSHMMRFRAMGTAKTEDLLVSPMTESDRLPSGQLRFTRYGDVLVLREFAAPTDHSGIHYVSRCIPTRREKQMARNVKHIARTPSQAQHDPIEIAINTTPLP